MIKQEKIMCLVKYPGQKAMLKTGMENTLESFQNFVGGYIEVVPVRRSGTRNIILICNEEGLIKGLPYNGCFGYNFVGPVLCCCSDDDGDFCDLYGADVPNLIKEMNKGGQR